MKVKVNVQLNTQAIKTIQDAMEKALPLTMEAMKTEINNMQVVPKKDNVLEPSSETGVENGVGYISYNTPYARRLYYHPEYNFSKLLNPNAQGRWLDPFIHGEKKDWLTKTYGEKLKENAGGVIK